jgi:hypothetical protein
MSKMNRQIRSGVVSALALTLIVMCAHATSWAQRGGGGRHQHADRARNQATGGISFEGVPGLGFDYPHLAAVSRGRQPQGTVSGRAKVVTPVVSGIVPVFGYGFGGGYYEAPQPAVIVVQPQPQTIVVQPVIQPAPQALALPEPAEPAASARPATPEREVGEFVLIRRDGQIVPAVGFSVSQDRVTYITPEGARRSLSLHEVDTEATRQMNEAAGTSIFFQ